MDDVRIHFGTLTFDLRLPHARSIKDRRQALRSVAQRLRNRHLSVAQVGPTDRHQRVFLAVSAVAGSAAGLDALLDAAERVVYASEFDIGECRRDVQSDSFRS